MPVQANQVGVGLMANSDEGRLVAEVLVSPRYHSSHCHQCQSAQSYELHLHNFYSLHVRIHR